MPGIVQFDDLRQIGEPAAIFTRKGEGVAFGEVLMKSNDILETRTGIAVGTKRVLMPPGTYKKGWKKKE